MKKLRVLVVTAAGLIPPDNAAELLGVPIPSWKMEYDVLCALKKLGHEHKIIEVFDDLGHLRENIEEFKPHIVFNLVHEFHGVALYDNHIAAYLELLRQPYTGCNARGLLLAHDKVLAKKLMLYHRIKTPRFINYEFGKRFKKPPKSLTYPLLVKSATEDASEGISQSSVVSNEKQLEDRVDYIREQLQTDALVEEYIDGRELYVGIIGNKRTETFPPFEFTYSELPEGAHGIATHRAKWNEDYREKYNIRSRAAYKLPDGMEEYIKATVKKIYKILFLTGYARVDCRLRNDGTFFCLEANANCCLTDDDEFALAGEKAGLPYEQLIQRIITLGLGYTPAWKSQ